MSVCTIYAEGAPSLRFLQGPALSGAEGAGDDAADTTLVALHPGRACIPGSRPLQTAQRTGIHYVFGASVNNPAPLDGCGRRLIAGFPRARAKLFGMLA